MEAMAYGLVVISTDVGAISKHIRNGHNGFILSSIDEKQIVKEVAQIIRDTKNLHTISENAHTYAKEHFDIEIFQAEYKKIFKKHIQ